jgi:D-arabinose 1-dehydrogenase-like Zn-dependent alcohol dehydrogenase
MINPKEIDYTFVASLIPDVMNALYNEDAAKDILLNEIRDAFRIKQMQSKAWLIDQIQSQNISKDSKILIIGSWLGFTSWCLYKMGYQHITEIDLDARLEKFAKHLNRFNKNFTHISDDVNNIDTSKFDIVINTSCEHIDNDKWFKSLNSKSLVFLHSNNLPGYEHTNNSTDLNDMIKKYPLTLKYSGSLNFNDWQRFMLVGYPHT